MKTKLITLAVLSTLATVSAQAVEQNCAAGTVNCNLTDLGDKDQSADNSVSESTQNNPSSNSNQSGNTIAPDNRDVNHNSNDGSITGGNTSSHGGSAIGNKSDNRSDANASNGNQSTSNAQGQGQASYNDLANKNQTSNDVSNKLGQGQSSNNANDIANKVGQGQSSSNKVSSSNANDVANKQGQSSSNKVSGSKQGQSSSNDLSTKDNRAQSTNQKLANSGNSVSGSNSSNSMGKSGNSQTSVDASDRSVSNYSSLAYRIPEINHIQPVTLATPNSSTVVMQCGPYTGVRSEAVHGKYMGMFRQTELDQGKSDTIVSAVNQHGKPLHFLTEVAADGSILRIGSQNVITTSVISIGGSRSMNIGGGFGAGDYGQAGGGNSSQAQRVVSTVQSVPCVYDIIAPTAPRPVNQIRYDEPAQPDFSYLAHGQRG